MAVTTLLLLALAAAGGGGGGGGASAQEASLYDPVLLTLMFDRPREPLVTGLGNYSFVVPERFLPNRYRNMSLINRGGFNDYEIIIPANATIPDLSFPQQLNRDDYFSLFIPLHRSMAARLIEVLVGLRSYEEFVITMLYARSRLNPLLVNYAYSIALLHRPDTWNQPLPNFACVNPGRFIPGRGVGLKLREQDQVLTEEQRAQTPIEIPMDWTGSDLDFEHRVAYFREDIGVNLHHWQWHLLYPLAGPTSIMVKDRRGELFYYLHEQIMARYNFERLSNKLTQVTRFLNWREPIVEGYFPKLDTTLSSRIWPCRAPHQRLQDIARPVEQIYVDVEDIERWKDRIFKAIHEQRVQTVSGSYAALTESTGIDVLGNMVEANVLSPNPNLYGNLHNIGHILLAFIHDPDHRYLESMGVMGDTATAMRDPVFYRWHSFVDDLFQEHKNILPRYTALQLGYPGITITSVEVRTDDQNMSNLLITFWQQSDLDLSRGLDFFPRGPVYVRVTHLQHVPFTYTIQVRNTGNERRGTVRIFLAPRLDERGLPFRLRQQRTLFIQLDAFVVTMANGDNTITRYSNESSVTIPYERTFRNLDLNRPTPDTAEEDQFNYCGCGWPAHMLLPKGAPEGLETELFVMISNYDDDEVPQTGTNVCSDGWVYCGIRGELYPDRRAMGFPFDRPPPSNAETLASFQQIGNGNMFSIGVVVQHVNN